MQNNALKSEFPVWNTNSVLILEFPFENTKPPSENYEPPFEIPESALWK